MGSGEGSKALARLEKKRLVPPLLEAGKGSLHGLCHNATLVVSLVATHCATYCEAIWFEIVRVNSSNWFCQNRPLRELKLNSAQILVTY